MNRGTTVTIFTDGGSRGNPGPSAYGFVVYDENKAILHKEGNVLGTQTNNFAEYTAIIKALEWVTTQNTKPGEINFCMDSELAVKQMNGLYKVKSPTIRVLFEQVQNLKTTSGAKVSFRHVPRAENTIADSLVNLALDNE